MSLFGAAAGACHWHIVALVSRTSPVAQVSLFVYLIKADLYFNRLLLYKIVVAFFFCSSHK